MFMAIAPPLDKIFSLFSAPVLPEPFIEDGLHFIFHRILNLNGRGRWLDMAVMTIRTQQGHMEDRVNGIHRRRQIQSKSHRRDGTENPEWANPLGQQFAGTGCLQPQVFGRQQDQITHSEVQRRSARICPQLSPILGSR